MRKLRQAICWGVICQGNVTPEQAIARAKEIGYEAFDFVPREHWGAVREAGLELSLVVGHASLRDGMNRRENHDRIYEELKANILEAAQWGVRNLCCFSGDRYFGVSDMVGAELCAEVMTRIAPVADSKGINLVMELLNSKVNHPGYMCDHTEWGVHMCKMVNSPRVKLLYDIYHMQVQEGDLIRTIRDNLKWIAHFHTAGNPGRNDLDDTQEIYYPAIARALTEAQYDGFVAHEFSPKGDPLAAAQAVYDTWLVS